MTNCGGRREKEAQIRGHGAGKSTLPAPSTCSITATTVNVENRVISYDIKELGKQLKKIGMLIVQDQVWNRVTVNRGRGKIHALLY